MTQTQTFEFCKLDAIDLKVAHWLNSQCPDQLYNFLSFIAGHAYQRRGINLNAGKAYHEFIEIHKIIEYSEK